MTAATIWVAAAVGVACGLMLYPLAVSAVVLALVVLEVIRSLECGLDRAAGVERHGVKKDRPADGKKQSEDPSTGRGP